MDAIYQMVVRKISTVVLNGGSGGWFRRMKPPLTNILKNCQTSYLFGQIWPQKKSAVKIPQSVLCKNSQPADDIMVITTILASCLENIWLQCILEKEIWW